MPGFSVALMDDLINHLGYQRFHIKLKVLVAKFPRKTEDAGWVVNRSIVKMQSFMAVHNDNGKVTPLSPNLARRTTKYYYLTEEEYVFRKVAGEVK